MTAHHDRVSFLCVWERDTATGTPGICAVVPVPAWTTSCIIWLSSAAVCGLITRPSICGVVLVTVEPSAATIFCTR